MTKEINNLLKLLQAMECGKTVTKHKLLKCLIEAIKELEVRLDGGGL